MSLPEIQTQALPVDEIYSPFCEALNTQQTLIISAPTGSGKSTRVPQWLTRLVDKPVLVVEPRRVACRALADYIAASLGQQVGDQVGYSVRFEERKSAQTKLLFVTPGVALRLLVKGQGFHFGAVMLDEFHERGWETDLLAALLRRRLQEDPALKLIVTSATLDIEGLTAKLGAHHIEASGRTFPVQIDYKPLGANGPTHDRLDERVLKAVASIIEDHPEDDGEVLVFLPGKGELRDAQQRLEPLAKRHGLSVVQVHASLPLHELAKAYAAPKPGQRRIFLATNVAETSLTLPGITWVVDAGLVRQVIHRGQKTALALVPISAASADQRAGRAGRVRPGRCLRLWDERFKLQQTTPPELERMELDDVVLRAAVCGLDGHQFPQAPWVDPPPQFAFERAKARLIRASALDKDARITAYGTRLAALPVSVDEARMLVDTPEPLWRVMPDLVALLQRGQRMILPLDRCANPQEVLDARRELFRGCKHEVAESLRALYLGHPKKHGLHDAALQEARQLATSLRQLLDPRAQSPTQAPELDPPYEALIAHLLERYPESAFVLRERAQRHDKAPARHDRPKSQPWANGELEAKVEPFSPYNEEDQLKPHERPVAGLLLNTMWLGERDGLGVFARGDMLLPCRLKALAQAELGEVQIEEISLSGSKRAPVVVGKVTRSLAGVTLSAQEEPLKGQALIQAAAALICQNRLIKGTMPTLLDRLHLWGLLHQWIPTLETDHWQLAKIKQLPAPEPEAYLAAQLERMGLNSSDELELISAQDLWPDPGAWVGAQSFELEKVLEELPRQWEHQGALYRCEISIPAARVRLEPINQSAKQSKEPNAKLLPRFRGFRIIYTQASREVTLRG